MKRLHLLLIGLLPAGLLALAGCSRYDSAREGARNGRSGNYVERSLELGRRDQTEREPEGRGPGRDVVERGTVRNLSGTLDSEAGE